MVVFDLLGLSFGALKERRVRSALTILMVIIGVALMTSINGLGGGMNNYITEQMSTLGANVLVITPSATSFEHGPEQQSGMLTKLTPQTVRTIERIHGVKYVVPCFSGGATLQSRGRTKTATIQGMDQGKLVYVAPKTSLESGSFVSPGDSSGMVLGYSIAHPSDLDQPFAKIGQTVFVEFSKVENQGGVEKPVTKRKAFQVRGILEELGGSQDSQVFVSLAAANALFEKSGAYDSIYAITYGPDENDKVEASIKKVYGKNIGVMSPKALASTIQEMMGTFIGFLSAIAMVSMLVGAVGIITTLYTSVMERTREIGLLKALGYMRETVLLMFLTESFTIGLLGGLLGLVAGIGGAYLLIGMIMPMAGSAGMSIIPSFLAADLAQVFLLACALSVIAGLYPAWRASTLSPIMALKKE